MDLRRVISFCSTSGTRRATPFKNPVISYERGKEEGIMTTVNRTYLVEDFSILRCTAVEARLVILCYKEWYSCSIKLDKVFWIMTTFLFTILYIILSFVPFHLVCKIFHSSCLNYLSCTWSILVLPIIYLIAFPCTFSVLTSLSYYFLLYLKENTTVAITG